MAAGVMSYDPLLETANVLRDGVPARPAVLTRRRRHIALAADRIGSSAGVLFARRGSSGHAHLDVSTVRLLQGEWHITGGGGAQNATLEPRARAADALGGHIVQTMGGAGPNHPVVGDGVRTRWIRHAVFEVSDEVAELGLDGRTISVHSHGYVLVLWRSRALPEVHAISTSGAELERTTPWDPLRHVHPRRAVRVSQ